MLKTPAPRPMKKMTMNSKTKQVLGGSSGDPGPTASFCVVACYPTFSFVLVSWLSLVSLTFINSIA